MKVSIRLKTLQFALTIKT